MTTLHIPLDRNVRDGLAAKAKRLGFDSVQAYIRVWAKAEAEGRSIAFDDDWGEPSPAATARLHRLAVEAQAQNDAGDLKGFHSAAEFLNDVRHAQGD